MKSIATVLTITLFMLSYVPYSYCTITPQEFKKIASLIKEGKALSPKRKKVFTEITKELKGDKSLKSAIDQINDRGIIYKTFDNSKSLKQYREMVYGIFKKLNYEETQPLTNIVSNLINNINELNEDDFETPACEEWETSTISVATQLVTDSRKEIEKFFETKNSFDYLRNKDAIAALNKALDYGIEDIVRFFIVKNNSLTKNELDQYLEILEASETKAFQPDRQSYPWFYMENGANYLNCKKVIEGYFSTEIE